MMLARISRTMAMSPSQTTSSVIGSTLAAAPARIEDAPDIRLNSDSAMARPFHQQLAVKDRADGPAWRNDGGRAAILYNRGAGNHLIEHEGFARMDGALDKGSAEIDVAHGHRIAARRRRRLETRKRRLNKAPDRGEPEAHDLDGSAATMPEPAIVHVGKRLDDALRPDDRVGLAQGHVATGGREVDNQLPRLAEVAHPERAAHLDLRFCDSFGAQLIARLCFHPGEGRRN